MGGDTEIGGSARSFPQTRLSFLADAASEEPATRERAFGALVEAYWKPLYKLARLRSRLDNEDAKDLVQSFFARLLEKGALADFDPSRARFRTFLRALFDAHAAKVARAARAQKRGGGARTLRLDFDAAESELAGLDAPNDVELFFEREYLRGLYESALDDVRARAESAGRASWWALFARCDLEPSSESERPSYRELAETFEIPVTTVTNRLHAMRQELRSAVLARVQRLAPSESEYRAEVRSVLGIDAP